MTRRSIMAVAISLVVVFALGAGGGIYTAALFSDSQSISGSFSTVETFDPIEEHTIDSTSKSGSVDGLNTTEANETVPAIRSSESSTESSTPSHSGPTANGTSSSEETNGTAKTDGESNIETNDGTEIARKTEPDHDDSETTGTDTGSSDDSEAGETEEQTGEELDDDNAEEPDNDSIETSTVDDDTDGSTESGSSSETEFESDSDVTDDGSTGEETSGS